MYLFYPTNCEPVTCAQSPSKRDPRLVVRGLTRETDTGGGIPPTLLLDLSPNPVISSDNNFVSTTSSPPHHLPSQGKEDCDNVALKARALLSFHRPLAPISPLSFSRCFPRLKRMQACHYYRGSLQRPMYCEFILSRQAVRQLGRGSNTAR